jgi:hypothetical protein
MRATLVGSWPLWRYAISEHVIRPYDTATKVLKNLDRMLAGLVLVRPES